MLAETNRPSYWRLATSDGTPRSAFKIAIVVGTVLVVINQGDVILAGSAPNLMKMALTYIVPYLVATYGAVSAKRVAWRKRQGSAAPQDRR